MSKDNIQNPLQHSLGSVFFALVEFLYSVEEKLVSIQLLHGGKAVQGVGGRGGRAREK